jgi:hypothetical protein
MRFLCRIGIHKWDTREIHQAAPYDKSTGPYMMSAVIDRCKCGTARIAIGGGDRLTCFVRPTKFNKASPSPESEP